MLDINENDVVALSSENMDCVDYAREFLGALGSREEELRLAIAKTIRKGADREQYAHRVLIRLNEKKEAEPEYGAVCEFVRDHGSRR